MTNTSRIDNILWTALVTPLTEQGHIDFEALGTLLLEQQQAGNGILILGSTGESLNLSDSERRNIVDFTLEQNLSVPVMVGVGGHSLSVQLSWIDFLRERPIDACLMVTPLYSKPGPEGQYHWFKTLMDACPYPVMLYNIPSRAGTSLHLDAVARLVGHPRLWAIKEASGSVDDFKAYKRVAGSTRVYSGDDVMLPEFAPHGAAGVVSVAGNVWPGATRLYAERALSGALTTDERTLWSEAARSLFVAANPVPVKTVLHAENRITSSQVKLPLHKNDMRELPRVLAAVDHVKAWYQKLEATAAEAR